MVRISLTICGLTVLLGATSGAQQNTPPQNRTAEGFSVQQARPTPSPRPGVVPGKVSPVTPAQGAAVRGTQPQGTAPPANRTGATAPKKNPGVAGATAPAQTAPMGPPPPPAEIPQPSRPADMPPVPPQVTYKNGMLTVNAVNSTMSSLLAAIRSKTGIEFEGAENSAERVAINVGPAPEGEVLAGIFTGSSFDYVVLDRADSPGTVQRVILTPRGKPGPAMAGPPQQQQPNAQQQAEEDNTGDDAADNADQPDPQDSANQPPQPNQPPATQNQPENSGPKTPEQLLQELKQMQQQQQQQQGQPPPDPNSVPRKMPPR